MAGTSGGCFVTDPAGIRPLGSVPGHEARELVQNAASAGLATGISLHNLFRDSAFTFDIELLEDTIITGFMAKFYSMNEIKSDEFYSRRSVSNCVENVTLWSMTWTIYLLDFEPNQLANERNNTVALGAVGTCDLVPTGDVLHVGNAVSF